MNEPLIRLQGPARRFAGTEGEPQAAVDPEPARTGRGNLLRWLTAPRRPEFR